MQCDFPKMSGKAKEKKDSCKFVVIACVATFVHIKDHESLKSSSRETSLGALMAHDWVVDSGASSNMACVLKGFQKL